MSTHRPRSASGWRLALSWRCSLAGLLVLASACAGEANEVSDASAGIAARGPARDAAAIDDAAATDDAGAGSAGSAGTNAAPMPGIDASAPSTGGAGGASGAGMGGASGAGMGGASSAGMGGTDGSTGSQDPADASAPSEDATVDAAPLEDDDAGESGLPEDAGLEDASIDPGDCSQQPELPWNDVDENCDGLFGPHFVAEHHVSLETALANMRLREGFVHVLAGTDLRVRAVDALDVPLAPSRSLDVDFYAMYDVREGVLVALLHGDANAGSLRELVIFEWTDRSQAPIERARLTLPASFEQFVLSDGGRFVYATHIDEWGRRMLTVYDLVAIDAPAARGARFLNTWESGETLLFQQDGAVYALDSTGGNAPVWRVLSCDVSDPDAPFVTEVLGALGGERPVPTAHGVYVVSSGGLRRIDLPTGAASPVLSDMESAEVAVMDADARGAFYVQRSTLEEQSSAHDALCFVDALTLERSCAPIDPTLAGAVSYLAVDGDDLVLGNGWQVIAYDVSDPTAPVRRAQSWGALAGASSLVLHEQHAYIAGPDGLAVLDVEAEALIAGLALDTDDDMAGIVLHSSHALVAGGGHLSSVDLLDPQHPHVVSRVAYGHRGERQLVLAERGGSTLAVIPVVENETSWLVLVDVTDPAQLGAPIVHAFEADPGISTTRLETLVVDAQRLYAVSSCASVVPPCPTDVSLSGWALDASGVTREWVRGLPTHPSGILAVSGDVVMSTIFGLHRYRGSDGAPLATPSSDSQLDGQLVSVLGTLLVIRGSHLAVYDDTLAALRSVGWPVAVGDLAIVTVDGVRVAHLDESGVRIFGAVDDGG